MLKKFVLLTACVVVFSGCRCGTPASAQELTIVPPQQNLYRDGYDVKVVNELGEDAVVRIVGSQQGAAFYQAKMRRNANVTANFYPGTRVACAWSVRSGRLLLMATVEVDRDGMLRLRDVNPTNQLPPATSTIEEPSKDGGLQIEPPNDGLEIE